MKDCGHAETASVNSIADNIRSARHNKFARFGFTTRMPKVRMSGETLRGIKNPLCQSARSRWIIPFNISVNADQICTSRFGPDYSHDGGGNKRFLPHERSQRLIFS
jgi:hypothetical protein